MRKNIVNPRKGKDEDGSMANNTANVQKLQHISSDQMSKKNIDGIWAGIVSVNMLRYNGGGM